MSGHHHDQPFPPGALLCAAIMVGSTLAVTAAPSLGLVPRPQQLQTVRTLAEMPKLAERDLIFLDQPDGSVMIRDVKAGNVAATVVAGGKTGFIRGVMRGLARDRKARGVGPEVPFRLTLWQDQHLSLEDLASGRTIELNSFGDTNRASFAMLLAPQLKAPTKVAAR